MLLFCIQKANLNLELYVQKITIWVVNRTRSSSIATIWWKCLIWCVHKFDLKGKVMRSFVRFQNLLLSLGSHSRKMLLKTLACLKDLIVHFRPPSIVPCQQWWLVEERPTQFPRCQGFLSLVHVCLGAEPMPHLQTSSVQDDYHYSLVSGYRMLDVCKQMATIASPST